MTTEQFQSQAKDEFRMRVVVYFLGIICFLLLFWQILLSLGHSSEVVAVWLIGLMIVTACAALTDYRYRVAERVEQLAAEYWSDE